MKTIGFRWLVVVSMAYALLGMGCATVETASPDVLRVGVTADYPPLIFKEKGQIKGLEADLAKRMAQALGREMGKGTTADLFVQDKMRRAKPVSISNSEDSVGALKRKKIDIYIADAPTIWWLASRHEADGVKGLFEPLTREYLSWAVARQNSALLDEVNDVLARWKADGSLDQSLSLWIP